MATLSIVENKAIVEIGHTKLELHNDGGNCWELVFEEYHTLDIRELKALNQMGFVYHSAQTDIDYENEDGTTSYMDIYYFARVPDTAKLFEDCMPL